jgi:predicted ATPase
VPEFLSIAIRHGFQQAVQVFGGAFGLRNFDAPRDEPLSFALNVGDVRWEAQISVEGVSINPFFGEQVTIGNSVLFARDLFSNQPRVGRSGPMHMTFGLTQLAASEDAANLAPLLTYLQRVRYRSSHLAYALVPLRVQGSQVGNGSEYSLEPDGRNAFTLLRNWRDVRQYHERFEFVVASLKEAFPDLCAGIEFNIAALIVSVAIVRPGVVQTIPPILAPDGWLIFLLHLCALVSAEPGSFLAFDEIENSLHPFAIRKLIQFFRAWAEEHDITICMATHSPVVLDEFKEEPQRLFVLEKGEKKQPVRVDELLNPEWVRHFSLGQLYTHGDYGSPNRASQDDHGAVATGAGS